MLKDQNFMASFEIKMIDNSIENIYQLYQKGFDIFKGYNYFQKMLEQDLTE